MVATGVMKTLIPLHLPQLGTPIHNNGLQWRKETPENMDATVSVSAGKEASWRFSADFPYYPMNMALVADVAELCQLQSLRAIGPFYYPQDPF